MRPGLLAILTVTITLLVGAAPASAFLIQAKSGPISATNGIALGPDGNFWIAETFTGSVVRMSPAGTVLGRFTVGTGATSVTTGPGGRVWIAVTEADKLVWIDALSAAPTTHDVPTGPPAACGPVGLVAGNNGRMYFSAPGDGAGCTNLDVIGSVADDGTGPIAFTPAGTTEAYDLEVSSGKLFAPDYSNDDVLRLNLLTLAVEATINFSTNSGPDGITADGAGNLWVTENASGRVARFAAGIASGGNATEFTPTGGTLTSPFGIVAGPDGRMYVAGAISANIVRVSADGGSFAFYAAPPTSEPWNIVNGPDGDLWATNQISTNVLRLINTAPRAAAAAATATGPTSATVAAGVDPRGNDTQVVFDYGPTTAYGATTAPTTVPNGAAPVAVNGSITGLTPSTTYHVRVRASNPEGSVAGDDVTFTTPADADRDGISPPADCNDLNAAIRPGAIDKPGNAIDEDCSGTAAFPKVAAKTSFTVTRFATSTIVKTIRLKNLAGGETATIRCSGRRCPFTAKTFRKLRKGSRTFGRALLRGRRLPVGSKLTVRVTALSRTGTSVVLEVRRRKAPKITSLCLIPGTPKASKCP